MNKAAHKVASNEHTTQTHHDGCLLVSNSYGFNDFDAEAQTDSWIFNENAKYVAVKSFKGLNF